jgi:predicted DNA-binding transcriptional regulator AlpA
MLDHALSPTDLSVFFAVTRTEKNSNDPRALRRIINALGIRLVGRTTRWPVIWRAIGLSEVQDPSHWCELTAPLLTAEGAAELLGVSSSIIYRWSKGDLPSDMPAFPDVIDLSGGRARARAKRWRRAEVRAWHMREPLPQYQQPTPKFGGLEPRP